MDLKVVMRHKTKLEILQFFSVQVYTNFGNKQFVFLSFSSFLKIAKNFIFLPFEILERWPSGLRRTLGKRVYAISVPGVRIPSSPQKISFF